MINKIYKMDAVKFLNSVEENSVHGSDSNENARIEIDFFFSKREIFESQ